MEGLRKLGEISETDPEKEKITQNMFYLYFISPVLFRAYVQLGDIWEQL
jgi:hypothetical protein